MGSLLLFVGDPWAEGRLAVSLCAGGDALEDTLARGG